MTKSRDFSPEYEEKEKLWNATQNSNSTSQETSGVAREMNMDMNTVAMDEGEHIAGNFAAKPVENSKHLPQTQDGRLTIKKTTKIPPINIFGQTTKKNSKLSELQIKIFYVKNATKDVMVVRTENLEDFVKIRQSLRDGKALHSTYTPTKIKT